MRICLQTLTWRTCPIRNQSELHCWLIIHFCGLRKLGGVHFNWTPTTNVWGGFLSPTVSMPLFFPGSPADRSVTVLQYIHTADLRSRRGLVCTLTLHAWVPSSPASTIYAILRLIYHLFSAFGPGFEEQWLWDSTVLSRTGRSIINKIATERFTKFYNFIISALIMEQQNIYYGDLLWR